MFYRLNSVGFPSPKKFKVQNILQASEIFKSSLAANLGGREEDVKVNDMNEIPLWTQKERSLATCDFQVLCVFQEL